MRIDEGLMDFSPPPAPWENHVAAYQEDERRQAAQENRDARTPHDEPHDEPRDERQQAAQEYRDTIAQSQSIFNAANPEVNTMRNWQTRTYGAPLPNPFAGPTGGRGGGGGSSGFGYSAPSLYTGQPDGGMGASPYAIGGVTVGAAKPTGSGYRGGGYGGGNWGEGWGGGGGGGYYWDGGGGGYTVPSAANMFGERLLQYGGILGV